MSEAGRALDLPVAERLEIEDLYSRYNQSVDRDLFDSWVDCFTADGTFESAETHRGREALAAFVRTRAGQQAGLPFRDAQHWTSNRVLEHVGEELHGSCYLVRFAVDRATGEFLVVTLGRYEDVLAREDGAWKFRRRVVVRA